MTLNALSRGAAFTLVEAVVSLGITAVAFLALLGLYPVGLRDSARSMLETRGSHLAYAAFTGLRAGPFEDALCLGVRLNLAERDEESPLTMEARFSPAGTLLLQAPGEGQEPGAVRVKVCFHKITAPSGAVLGNRVTLQITPLREASGKPLEFQTVIGAL